MASFSDSVRDQYNRPVLGALVYIYTKTGTLAELRTSSGGALANPIKTDASGIYEFDADGAVYRREVRYAGLLLDASDIIVGDPPEFVGPTGPANSTYPTLAALKAADPTNLSYILTTQFGPIPYNYVVGNFTGEADDVMVVKLDAVPLTQGALVRRVDTVFVDDFARPADADDRGAFERAVSFLVARNGRGGGVIRLTQGRTYNLPGSIALRAGIVILGHERSMPNTLQLPDASYGIVNSTQAPTFTYAPEAGNDDRLTCPSIIGVRIQADFCVDFGFDDDVVSYFMSNGFIRDCWLQAYTPFAGNVPGGGTAVRMVENYRGGIEGCWINGYKTGVVQKSGDLCAIRRNRIFYCSVNIAVVSPATTGTQTVIEHNDLLDASAAWPNPDFGGAYVIYSEDRWAVIRDNYFESSYTGGLCKNAIIKFRDSAAPFSLGNMQQISVERNRFDYNSDQASSAIDFTEAQPIHATIASNLSNKGPTPLTTVAWPDRFYFAIGIDNTIRRRIDWRQATNWPKPPFSNRPPNADRVLDAGTMNMSTGTQGARLYADRNYPDAICFDYDKDASAAEGGPNSEHYIWHANALLPYLRYWDVEVDYASSINGVEIDLQVRNSFTGYVDSAVLTCSTEIKTYRRKGVLRENMLFNIVGRGTVSGQVRIHAIRIRHSNIRVGEKVYDAPSIAASGFNATTVFVQDAAIGDTAHVTLDADLQGLMVSCYVNAPDTVGVIIFNPTASAIDLGSTRLSAWVEKP